MVSLYSTIKMMHGPINIRRRSIRLRALLPFGVGLFFIWVKRHYYRMSLSNSMKLNTFWEHNRCSRLVNKFPQLDCSVYTCLTQLYGDRDMYNLLHKEQLHFSALFIGHLQVGKWKLSKQLHSTCVGCIQWRGKRWSGYEISHVLCKMGGVVTWVLLFSILG